MNGGWRSGAKEWAAIGLVLAACSGPGTGSGPETRPEAGYRGIIYSPNGEPLSGGSLGHPKCEEALAGWLERIDSRHAGFIDHDPFIADANAQFARMDLNHDGLVTPAELETYRLPYTEARAETPRRRPKREGGEEARDQGGGSSSLSGPWDAFLPHSTKRLSGGMADPVMTADKALRFRVSLDDFLALAEENFARLAPAPSRRLDREAAAGTCRKDK